MIYTELEPVWSLTQREKRRLRAIAQASCEIMPRTITSVCCERSTGDLHDFYSEGDYWWPDPVCPDGPYVRKDGLLNPNIFQEHRRLLIKMCATVGNLTAGWLVTADKRFAQHAVRYLLAWFVNPHTSMRPRLCFAQAIQGRTKGRGIGIVDTVHLAEVALATSCLVSSQCMTTGESDAVLNWFREYVDWLQQDRNGLAERNEKNNHGTCWVMQVAAFATLLGDVALASYCRDRFKEVLLPTQVAQDGSLPLELARTRPYNYSLFNLELLSAVCEVLSHNNDDLWKFTLPDGRGMSLVMEHMIPFVREKECWPYKEDIAFFSQWPRRHAFILFWGVASRDSSLIELWRSLPPDPGPFEVQRNMFIRQPLIWFRANASFQSA